MSVLDDKYYLFFISVNKSHNKLILILDKISTSILLIFIFSHVDSAFSHWVLSEKRH